MVCRDFILPEPASYVFFYALFNLRNLLYIILLGFVFQFIARHLLYIPERYSGGKFRNFPPLLSHVCPAALSFDGYHLLVTG